MATEAKPFASLSSGLLARKGAARPAMRPQGFSHYGQPGDDLGWNDMGYDAPRPAPTERPAVLRQQVQRLLGDPDGRPRELRRRHAY